MSDDPLNVLLDAIVAGLKDGLGLDRIARHPGRFGKSELDRYGAQAPCVKLAFLGLAKVEEVGDGEVDVTLRIGAYLICADKHMLSRDVQALGLTGTLSILLVGQVWGLEGVHPVEAGSIRCENLYGTGSDKGVMVLGFEWRQTVRLGVNDFAEWIGTLKSLTVNGPANEVVEFGEAANG